MVARKILIPNDFADLDVLAECLLAFQERYEWAAKPFAWKFSPATISIVSSFASPNTNRPCPHPLLHDCY
jgi:hypothetical protein